MDNNLDIKTILDEFLITDYIKSEKGEKIFLGILHNFSAAKLFEVLEDEDINFIREYCKDPSGMEARLLNKPGNDTRGKLEKVRYIKEVLKDICEVIIEAFNLDNNNLESIESNMPTKDEDIPFDSDGKISYDFLLDAYQKLLAKHDDLIRHIDWEYTSTLGLIPRFLQEYEEYIDIPLVLVSHKYKMDYVQYLYDKFPQFRDNIIKTQDLTEKFIRDNIDDINLSLCSEYQEFSKEFIEEFAFSHPSIMSTKLKRSMGITETKKEKEKLIEITHIEGESPLRIDIDITRSEAMWNEMMGYNMYVPAMPVGNHTDGRLRKVSTLHTAPKRKAK